MNKLALLLLSSLAVISFCSQALADGFTYAGSPKLGAYYVKSDARKVADWTAARAQLRQSAPVPTRGGIGLRTP